MRTQRSEAWANRELAETVKRECEFSTYFDASEAAREAGTPQLPHRKWIVNGRARRAVWAITIEEERHVAA